MLRLIGLLVLLLSWAVNGPRTVSAADLTVDELVQRKLSSGDDWPTEKLHDGAKHQLEKIASLLVDPDKRSQPDLAGLAVSDAKSSDLRPVETAKAYTVGEMQVQQIRLLGMVTAELSLGHSLSELMAPYGTKGGQRIAFKALRVERENERQFQTDMFFHCFGDAPTGVVEQHGLWEISWKMGEDPDHSLIERIVVREFTETSAVSVRFVDQTSGLLRGVPAWTASLLSGADYWHQRVDTLGGVTFLGHEGLAVGDLSGDGLDDLHVAQGAGFANLLLVQNPDGTVTDIAPRVGLDYLDVTRGSLIIDIDDDGDQDLCTAVGPRVLVLLNDEGRFTLVAALRPPDESDFYSLAAADYDRDGDLDLYATRYVVGRYGVTIPLPWHDARNGPSNHLFRNDGKGRFTDVTREVGLDTNNRRFSLAASWADYDDDNDPDLYVANDFGRNNLYRNDGGKFTDVAALSGTEDQAAGMGVSWADFDLDGRLDLHVGNMFSSAGRRIAYQARFLKEKGEERRKEFQRHASGNSLYRNEGNGQFVDVSDRAGVRMGRWSWGARFADVNGDGYPDILSPNGFITNTEKDDL